MLNSLLGFLIYFFLFCASFIIIYPPSWRKIACNLAPAFENCVTSRLSWIFRLNNRTAHPNNYKVPKPFVEN